MGSTAVANRRLTVLQACHRVLKTNKNEPLSPSDIAKKGLAMSLFEVPRGRTPGYLSQIIQSTLYNEAHYTRCSTMSNYCGRYWARR